MISNIFLNFKIKLNNRFYLKQQIFNFFLKYHRIVCTTILSYYASYLISINTSIYIHSTGCTAHSIYWPYVWMWASWLCACASEYFYLDFDWLRTQSWILNLEKLFVQKSIEKVWARVGYTARSYSQLFHLILYSQSDFDSKKK